MTDEADRVFLEGIARAAEVAGATADEVDRAAAFPAAAIDALRAEGALAAGVPAELGGPGVSPTALARGCAALGATCSATGMIFAMHAVQVASIARHLEGAPWFADYLRRLTVEQRLIASATSEVQTGGDLGRSSAALRSDGPGRWSFEKQAPTISYGAYADDLLTTLRRHPEAEAGDQVLVLTSREQTDLEPTGAWDTLGMRGTCSPGFVVRAQLPAEQVLAVPFARISAETMVPVSHVLWSHVWLGIAEDAFARARAFVRATAQRSGGAAGPAGEQLAQLHGKLSQLRGLVAAGLADFVAVGECREELATMASGLRYNALKLTASEQAPAVCEGALAICGITGFRNDTPYSVGRHLRDSLSAQVMVANSRLRASNAGLLLVVKNP